MAADIPVEEAKAQLLSIQKSSLPNAKCIDCSAPSPTWASPILHLFAMFGSITMDRWSIEQLTRMEKGGNARAREFFENKFGPGYKTMTIPEKYDSDIALDYKDKLTAEIEGKVWTPVARPARPPRSSTPLQTPSKPLSRASSTSSFQQPQTPSQKAKNETYFASLGSANSQRPEGLPPSQGGRYTGFGSAPPPPAQQSSQNESLSVEDFAADPLGSLTKGWSMFSKVAVKTASMVNETYVQPSVAKIQDPNFHESIKRNITTAADTVQKTGFAGYQAFGKQVSTHTGVQLPGAVATSPVGSPVVQRKEDDYDDFWAENGIKDVEPKKAEPASFAGQSKSTTASAKGGKDDEWENW